VCIHFFGGPCILLSLILLQLPVPAAARSQALVWGRSLTVIAGSNPARGMDVCHLCVCVFCVLSVRGLCVGLIIRPEESYGDVVSKCDRESSIMRKCWPTGAVAPWIWNGPFNGVSLMTVFLHRTWMSLHARVHEVITGINYELGHAIFLVMFPFPRV